MRYYSPSILQSPFTLPNTMLSSISSAGKSGSNWLHRLRSSKGLPSGADLDLEQFLDHSHDSNSSNTEQSAPTTNPESKPSTEDPTSHSNQRFETQNQNEDKQLLSIMSTVLAELFVMGDSNHLPKLHGKKCSRKQPNPRFCVHSSSSDLNQNNNNNNDNDNATGENEPRKDESASPLSDDYSGIGMLKDMIGDRQVKVVENENCGEEEEQEKGCVNLSGFSRTEVTVIDTSFATWKFEKMLFRKKNVWKVRDKKGKMLNFGKKRKASTVENENVDGGEEKKQKVLHGQCSLPETGSGGALNRQYHESNKSEAACKRTSDTIGKALKKKQATLNLEKRKIINYSYKKHTRK